MRHRIGLALVLTAALIATGADGLAVTHIPPNARNLQGWLGTWKIKRFGELVLSSIRYKHDETLTNFAGGHDFWSLSGYWTDPKGRTFRFAGPIDARDHLVLTAHVATHDGPDSDDIYLVRNGDEIEHGYWTHYVIAKPPEHHHPLTGNLEEPFWRVGFRFTQDDGNGDPHANSIRSGGAGTIVWQHEPKPGSMGQPVGKTRIFVVATEQERTLRMTIDITSGQYATHGRTDSVLTLGGEVLAANDPDCKAGAEINVLLVSRLGKAEPDSVRVIAPFECVNFRRGSADPNRVSVHVESPRPTSD